MFGFYMSTLSKILSLLQAVASKPWNIHLMCNAPKDYHLYSVFWFLKAFLITSLGNINLFSWIVYHIFLYSKIRDILSPLSKAIVEDNCPPILNLIWVYPIPINSISELQLKYNFLMMNQIYQLGLSSPMTLKLLQEKHCWNNFQSRLFLRETNLCEIEMQFFD